MGWGLQLRSLEPWTRTCLVQALQGCLNLYPCHSLSHVPYPSGTPACPLPGFPRPAGPRPAAALPGGSRPGERSAGQSRRGRGWRRGQAAPSRGGGPGCAFKCGGASRPPLSARRERAPLQSQHPGHAPAVPASARLSRRRMWPRERPRPLRRRPAPGPGAASVSPLAPGRSPALPPAPCPFAMQARVLLLAALAALALAREPPAAPCPARCDVSRCPSPRCPGGYVPDLCNCCLVCAASEGEPCGGPLDSPCGESLECTRGVCRCRWAHAVCGTDGHTYANVCALEAASRRALRLSGSPVRQLQKGACPSGKCWGRAGGQPGGRGAPSRESGGSELGRRLGVPAPGHDWKGLWKSSSQPSGCPSGETEAHGHRGSQK